MELEVSEPSRRPPPTNTNATPFTPSSLVQSNGYARQESGTIENEGQEDEAISVRGSYEWLGEDGVKYIVNWLADRNGFQPEGDHLPKSA